MSKLTVLAILGGTLFVISLGMVIAGLVVSF